MKITAIRQQVRRPIRYSIFIDEKYSFSLSDTALLASRLATGDILTPADIADWKKKSQDDKLYSQALRFLAVRLRSSGEVAAYLARKDADPPLIQQLLNRLSNLQLLDDEVFAKAWLADRRLLKPMSRRRIAYELQAKHVPRPIIDQVLAEDETDDVTTLVAVIANKRRQSRYQDDVNLLRYLARQGYSYSDIKQALEAS